MAFVSGITLVGIAAAEAAQAGMFQIEIDSASFSSDLLTPTVTAMQSVTSITNIVYTASSADVTYHIVTDDTIMIRVNLPPGTGPFSFGSYTLNLADGTPFVAGTWTALQTKDENAARYVEQSINFSNLVPTINLTIINTIDAALPEVPTEDDLPDPPVSAPYPVYYVHKWTVNNVDSIAARNPDDDVWRLFPAAENSVAGSVTGTNHTYAITDNFRTLPRSNFGAVMVDTLPGTSPGILPAGWFRTIRNVDATGILLIKPGSGTTFNGSSTYKLYLGPQQEATIESDGTKYFTRHRPDHCKLTADLSVYVSSSGSDTNDAIVIGSPLFTLQKAWDFAVSTLDLNNLYSMNIRLAIGTYTTAFVGVGMPVGANLGRINIIGDNSTPTNYLISDPAGIAIGNGASLGIFGLTIAASGTLINYSSGGVGLTCTTGGSIGYGYVNFGVCNTGHMNAADGGTITTGGNPYTIVGGAQWHIAAQNAGNITTVGSVVTILGGPTISYYALAQTAGSLIVYDMSFVGGIIGQKYSASSGGNILTHGSGINYLPGTIPGDSTTGYYL